MNENQNELLVQNEVTFRELEHVYDVPVRISIEVGRLRLRVRDLITLVRGSVVELKKPAGEPFDICINGVAVARGEVITVDQYSGVRITDVHKAGGFVS